jgi:membrane-associated HD superfamily phosphohydrolase
MNEPKMLQRWTIFAIAFLLAAGATAFFAVQKSNTLPEQRPYSIGEKARNEIVAPKKFAVVDAFATEVRRQTAAMKVPVVFRFERNADQAAANFSTEYVFAREKFLDTVEQSFKTRRLTTNQVGTKFRKVFNNFHANNKSYPVGIREATYWAQHALDQNRVKQMSAKVLQANERLIRPENFSPTNLTSHVRIVSGSETPSLEFAKQQSRLLRRTNVVGLSKARAEFLRGFQEENPEVQRFMANYVRPNLTFDAELTGKFRAEKTNAISILAPYAAGDVIVHRGEIINAKTKAALDTLKIQVPIAAENNAKQAWLWAAALVLLVMALAVGSAGFMRRSRKDLLPAGNVLVLPEAKTADDELRAKLIPHLTRGLMNRFVRALISQRSDLMQTQNVGTEQLSKLEERLDQISTRIENRQLFYESRIAQLEKELSEAEEENRELIRAKIHEARQNLEWAKAQASAGE